MPDFLRWRQPHDVRSGSSLCENSDVELARGKFVSITLNNKRTALAATVEGRKEREQFCAFSARARFHTAWVKSRPFAPSDRCPQYPQERTSSARSAMSESVVNGSGSTSFDHRVGASHNRDRRFVDQRVQTVIDRLHN